MSKVIRFKVANTNGIDEDVIKTLEAFSSLHDNVKIVASVKDEDIKVIIICDSQQAFNLGIVIGKIVMSYNVEYVFELVSHSCRTAINSLTSEDYTNPNDVMSRITNDLLGNWK